MTRLLSPLLSIARSALGGLSIPAGESGGQGRGRTADLPLFRIKDDSPGQAMLVSRPARDPAAARDDGP
jgi:hypothetical protein